DVVESRTRAQRFDLREELRRFGEPGMRELDVLLCGDELYLQPQHVAECAVGVREAVKQVRILRCRADNGAAVAQQDLHLIDGLVHQSVPERRRLDSDAAYCAADGDGLDRKS